MVIIKERKSDSPENLDIQSQDCVGLEIQFTLKYGIQFLNVYKYRDTVHDEGLNNN